MRNGPTPAWSYTQLTDKNEKPIDESALVSGKRKRIAGLSSRLRSSGHVVDLDLMTGCIPVANRATAEWITRFCNNVQCIPLEVEGLDAQLAVLNVVEVQELLSEQSRLLRDSEGVVLAAIDPVLIGPPSKGKHLFRIANAELDLYCDSEFRDEFVRRACKGVSFHPVRVL
jgi:hypothetical protein